MEFDQNITRPDLLPSTIPLAALIGLAVVGMVAWIIVHRVLHGRRETLRARVRFAILLPVATVGTWCLYQLVGRLLYLAGAWPLWISSLVTAAAVEGVSLFYERECSIVPPRLARALTFCRMLAVGITVFILMQPVYVRNRNRSIRRRVAVIVDESSSMNRAETQWTLGERLDMAQALGLISGEELPLAGAADTADALRARFRGWQQMLSAASSIATPADAAAGDAKAPAVDYAALARDAAEVSEWCAPLADAVAKLSETVKDGRYTGGRDAAVSLKKGHDALVAHSRVLSAKDIPERPITELLASAVGIVDGFDRFLLHHERAVDTAAAALWDSMTDERREAINRHVGLKRTLLAQSILAGSERRSVPSLFEKLRSRYDVDLFRMGGDLRRISDLGAHFQWLATNSVDAAAYAEKSESPVGPDRRAGRDTENPQSEAALSAAEAAEITFQSSTDITRALESVAANIPSEELAGVLLLTDGRHTGDAGVEAISRRLGLASVPVSTVVIGGTRPLLDVALADVRTAESVFLGDRVRVVADLAATGAKGEHVAVRLLHEGEVVDTKEFDIASDDWVREVRLYDQPEERGVRRYRIEADILSGETVTANNYWVTDVSVSDDRTNVLLVDQRPRWEYRYLRNLFYGRDKSVHLQYYLVEPDSISGQHRDLPPASAAREFGDAEAGSLPVSRDEWRKFDVLIFGDVGEDVLTPDVVENIRFCVEERGAMAVFISGPKSMPYGVHSGTFRDLLPVVPLTTPPASLLHGPEEAFHVTLTPAGRAHDIMGLSSSASENEQIWAEQPDWTWRIPIEDVKPGTEILAYAQNSDAASGGAGSVPGAAGAEGAADGLAPDSAEAAIARLNAIRRQQSRNALITVRGQGRGRVAMLLTDRTWRLRYRVGDTYHHRFWGQMMRWGVGEKLRAGNTYVRLGTDQLSYTPHEPVRILARLADEDFTPIQDAVVYATLARDDKVITRVALQHRPDSNGMYEATLEPIPTIGMYTVTLECKDAEKRLGKDYPQGLSTQFSVITARRPAEFVHATADWKAPRTMARLSGGRAVPPSRALTLWNGFGEGSGLVQDRIETNLWDSPWLFLVVLLCLTVEWLIRKRGGLA